MLKVSIIILLIVVAKARDFNLKFFENNSYHNETIRVNRTSIEYEVPTHGSVEGAKYLYDFDTQLVVMKLDRLSTCFAYDMESDEYNPYQVAAGVSQISGEFPEDRYMVVKEKLLPLRYLDPSLVTPTIEIFCGNYSIIKAAVFSDSNSMEEAVRNEVRTTLKYGGRHKRQTTVTDFYLCDAASMSNMAGCVNDGKQIDLKCRFVVSNTCVYKAACAYNSGQGWNCPVPTHIFTSLTCCDYIKC